MTKQELTAQTRGKGGTVVRWSGQPLPTLVRDTYVVKDLFTRKGYNDPNRVGIGPEDVGVAWGVRLDEITPA